MASLRSATRVAHAASMLVSRAAGSAVRSAAAGVAVARTGGVSAAAATLAKATAVRGFATAATLRATPVEKKLAGFLKQERTQEEDFGSDVVTQYLSKSPFKLHDSPESMEVKMTRTMGNETITITFEYEKDMNEENFPSFDEMQNEGEGEGQQDPANAEPTENTPHLPFLVQVSKKANGADKGTTTFECVADSGQVIITNVVFSKDSSVALGDDVNSDWKRGLQYPGPDFLSLEAELQEMFFEYLDERGINAELAEFLPEYINVKENKSYLLWLESLSKFFD